MGMYDDFLKIIKYLKSDETLLRLLYYPPEDGNGVLDPLEPSLPNIMDMGVEERSEITNLRILKSGKYTELEDNKLCRIYVYAGYGSSSNSNYLTANQEVVIDIFCHSDFENGDLRIARIADRLNELFSQEFVTGIGRMDFVDRRIIPAPNEYVAYQVIFKYSTFKR